MTAWVVVRDKPAYERLPKAPGQSSFHLKGQAFRGHMRWVEEELEGGTKAFLDGIVDDQLRTFFEQPFLASSWYDVFPLVAAGHVCAKLINVSFREFVRTRTRWQAEQDIHTVYKFLLRLTSPESVAMRMPRLISQYLDFGSLDVQRVRERNVMGELKGLPAFMVPWWSVVQETYVEYALALAGAKNPLVRSERPVAAGAVDGIEIVNLRADVTWEE